MNTRILVTGSRDWPNPGLVHLVLNFAYCECVEHGLQMVLVHGACPTGADSQAQDWADQMNALGFLVIVDPYPAKWRLHGRSAGAIRNEQMVKLGADRCIGFHHGVFSSGTSDCLYRAKKRDIETTVFYSERERKEVTWKSANTRKY